LGAAASGCVGCGVLVLAEEHVGAAAIAHTANPHRRRGPSCSCRRQAACQSCPEPGKAQRDTTRYGAATHRLARDRSRPMAPSSTRRFSLVQRIAALRILGALHGRRRPAFSSATVNTNHKACAACMWAAGVCAYVGTSRVSITRTFRAWSWRDTQRADIESTGRTGRWPTGFPELEQDVIACVIAVSSHGGCWSGNGSRGTARSLLVSVDERGVDALDKESLLPARHSLLAVIQASLCGLCPCAAAAAPFAQAFACSSSIQCSLRAARATHACPKKWTAKLTLMRGNASMRIHVKRRGTDADALVADAHRQCHSYK